MNIKIPIFSCLLASCLIGGAHQDAFGQDVCQPLKNASAPGNIKPECVSPAPKRRYAQTPVNSSVTVNVTCPVPGNAMSVANVEGKTPNNSLCERTKDETQWILFIEKLAWPLVVLVAIFFLGRKALTALLGKVHRIKGGGLEIEFTAVAANKVREAVSTTLLDYVKAADDAYSRQTLVFSIRDYLEGAVNRAIRDLRLVPRYRATVHVPDVIYADYLYQLLDYFPAGAGVGRRFSQRRGILGQVWRLSESDGVGHVIRYDRGPSNKPNNFADPEETLVREWSMTREEVKRYHLEPRLSFLCVVLRLPYDPKADPTSVFSTGRKVGVFYMDSINKDAFGTDKEAFLLVQALERAPEIVALAQAVDNAMQEMRKGNINLSIQNGNTR